MWQIKLKEINEIKKLYKQAENSGVSDEQLAGLLSETKKQYDFVLPESYIDFLKKENGFEFNGFIIYGIGGAKDCLSTQSTTDFISTNEIWHEVSDSKRYIFFGDSNISWYCFDKRNNLYVELDKPSLSLVKVFDNANNMLEGILMDCLQ